MKTYKNLYAHLCSFENLADAYDKARKHKKNNPKVREFDEHWRFHLWMLSHELRTGAYKPIPLKKFILRDPKTRVICVSDFRDRVIHHALVNVLQPIFEPRFIHDSYASRKGKGTLQALKRFRTFLRKVSKNGRRLSDKNANAVHGFALKADIKHYFDTVDHNILLAILSKRVKDEGVLWLIQKVLDQYYAGTQGKGMPLGNWTSQFFANVYLNELDQFVKHQLKAKYYIRYVDDFVILHKSKTTLQAHHKEINSFLATLKLELHPTKCRIAPLMRGVSLLGFRAFYQYTLVRRRNVRKIHTRLKELLDDYETGFTEATDVLNTFYGWNAHAVHGNTYRLRERTKNSIQREMERRTAIRIEKKRQNNFSATR